MSDARYIIEHSFKDLILEKPYAKITVSDICERSYLSRKSFYVYFDNKENILDSIFHADVIKPLRTINDLFSMQQAFGMNSMIYEKLYEQIYANAEFYTALVTPMKGKDDTFLRIATNAIYELDIDLLKRFGYGGDARKTDYVAYYFASSQAMLIQKWITDGMPYTPRDLANLYKELTTDFWLSTFDTQGDK